MWTFQGAWWRRWKCTKHSYKVTAEATIEWRSQSFEGEKQPPPVTGALPWQPGRTVPDNGFRERIPAQDSAREVITVATSRRTGWRGAKLAPGAPGCRWDGTGRGVGEARWRHTWQRTWTSCIDRHGTATETKLGIDRHWDLNKDVVMGPRVRNRTVSIPGVRYDILMLGGRVVSVRRYSFGGTPAIFKEKTSDVWLLCALVLGWYGRALHTRDDTYHRNESGIISLNMYAKSNTFCFNFQQHIWGQFDPAARACRRHMAASEPRKPQEPFNRVRPCMGMRQIVLVGNRKYSSVCQHCTADF